MRGWQQLAEHHPLLSRAFAAFIIVTLVIGFVHELRIIGEIGIVLTRISKEELAELRDTSRRLKRELTTKPESKTEKHSDKPVAIEVGVVSDP